MDYIEKDPSKVHVMNNYALVEFIDDDIVKNKLIFISKRNYSTKIRSNYVGKIIDRPNEVKLNAEGTYTAKLDNLIKSKTIVGYDPRSIQVKIKWKDKEYHIIRIEDVYCIVEDYEKENYYG